MRSVLLLIALTSPVLTSPVLAAERPVLPPTEDVAVTYKTDGAAAELIPGMPPGPATMHLSWSAATQQLRTEIDGRPQYVLVNRAAHTAQLVDRGLRSAINLPLRPKDLDALTLDGEDMTRQGEARYAGLACTNWAVRSSRGGGTVCLTPSGIPLHASGEVNGRRGSFTATEVQREAQPLAQFTVPDGYMAFALPSFGKSK